MTTKIQAEQVRKNRYIQAAITKILNKLKMTQGNDALNDAAFNGAQFFAHGYSEGQFFDELMGITTQSPQQAKETIKSGFRAGRLYPRDLSRLGNFSNQNPTRQSKKPQSKLKTKERTYQKEEKQRKEKTQDWAVALYKNAPSAIGSIGERYFATRGLIAGEQLKNKVCDFSNIHFLVNHKHKLLTKVSGQAEAYKVSYWPCLLLAGRKSPTSPVESVYRIYLSEDGKNKAPLFTTRKSDGSLKPDAKKAACAFAGHGFWIGDVTSKILMITEGIENAYSLYLMTDEQPLICAAFTSGNIANIQPPKGITTVYLAGDCDDAGHAANLKAKERLLAQGYTVIILDIVQAGMDINDCLIKEITP